MVRRRWLAADLALGNARFDGNDQAAFGDGSVDTSLDGELL
jgi:hypothetical protein